MSPTSLLGGRWEGVSPTTGPSVEVLVPTLEVPVPTPGDVRSTLLVFSELPGNSYLSKMCNL